MRSASVAIAITLSSVITIETPAAAERGYFSAPRDGAGHRAGAFYGNGPVTADPGRGDFHSFGRDSRPSGFHARPYRNDAYPNPYEAERHRNADVPQPGEPGRRSDENDGTARPYNPYYPGYAAPERKPERRAQSGFPETRQHQSVPAAGISADPADADSR